MTQYRGFQEFGQQKGETRLTIVPMPSIESIKSIPLGSEVLFGGVEHTPVGDAITVKQCLVTEEWREVFAEEHPDGCTCQPFAYVAILLPDGIAPNEIPADLIRKDTDGGH